MEKILEPILNSPRLKDYISELQEYLQSEEERRVFFYNSITEDEKAEFINGEIVIHSPVRLIHNTVLSSLSQIILEFTKHQNLGTIGVEKLMIRLTRNDYEPDLCFFNTEKAKQFDDEQKLFPAPDWIAEVLSKSTEKTDRGVKMEDYALHGVREYWLVEPKREYVEQYYIRHGSFFLNKIYSGDEIISSQVLTGLELPIAAIFNWENNKQYRKQFF